jgi:hypothetical protein
LYVLFLFRPPVLSIEQSKRYTLTKGLPTGVLIRSHTACRFSLILCLLKYFALAHYLQIPLRHFQMPTDICGPGPSPPHLLGGRARPTKSPPELRKARSAVRLTRGQLQLLVCGARRLRLAPWTLARHISFMQKSRGGVDPEMLRCSAAEDWDNSAVIDLDVIAFSLWASAVTWNFLWIRLYARALWISKLLRLSLRPLSSSRLPVLRYPIWHQVLNSITKSRRPFCHLFSTAASPTTGPARV